jgi:L-asparaginase
MSGIHIILTGGTIDSVYNPISETAEPAAKSCIPEYMKDSSDITPEIRTDILNAVLKTKAQGVLVIHGTNTMTTTQEFLNDKTEGKTVVLTGAMVPLKQFTFSDGGFNLGYALAQAQNLDAGVYICMHAKTFPVGQVRKNFDNAHFESL